MDALSLLIPALTALIGAWAGSQMGFSRAKRERAFERRLRWYEDMHAAMQGMDQTLQIAEKRGRTSGSVEEATILTEVAAAIQEMELLSRSAPLFGTPAAVAAIRSALREAGEVTREISSEFPTLGKDEMPEYIKALGGYREPLKTATSTLQRDVREHLGLEMLK